MTDQLVPGDPSDIRFQFSVIQALAESVRRQSDHMEHMHEDMREFNKVQNDILQRIVRIESKTTSEQIIQVEADMKVLEGRVDLLEKDKDRRDGAIGAWSWLARNWPIAPLLAALGLIVAWANGKLR